MFNPNYFSFNPLISHLDAQLYIVPVVDGQLPRMTREEEKVIRKAYGFSEVKGQGDTDCVYLSGKGDQKVLFIYISSPNAQHWHWFVSVIHSKFYKDLMDTQTVLLFVPATIDRFDWELLGMIMASTWDTSHICTLDICIPKKGWPQVYRLPSGTIESRYE